MVLNAKIKNLIVLFILAFIQFGCSDDDEQIIPYVRVNISFDLGLPQFDDLLVVGNAYIYPNEGYKRSGIIIYRNSYDEITAYDATCPKHIDSNPTAVVLDGGAGGGQAKCTFCNTIYYFSTYGYPAKGYPLQQYKVTKTGNTSYIISN